MIGYKRVIERLNDNQFKKIITHNFLIPLLVKLNLKRKDIDEDGIR